MTTQAKLRNVAWTYDFDPIDTFDWRGSKVTVLAVTITKFDGRVDVRWVGREYFKNGNPKALNDYIHLETVNAEVVLAGLGIKVPSEENNA